MNHPARKSNRMSLDDFEELLADCPDDERWELIAGRVVRMMVGARWEHNRIVNNIAAALDGRFRAKGSPCRTLTETFRLKDEAIGSSLLPDVIVYCKPLARGAAFMNTPTVLIEILSDGTRRRDREDKWAVYQQLPSLRHYVMIERDTPHIETFDRLGETWNGLRIATELEAMLSLPDVDVEIPLAEIYADVLEA